MSNDDATKNHHNCRHGHAARGKRTPEYTTWISMRRRCFDKDFHAYDRYGGRGITVCARWRRFENFLADMGKRPSAKHSLDRYPHNDGNYEPRNCRWATNKMQCNNSSKNRKLTLNGVTRNVSEWAEVLGVKRNVISQRLDYYGWSVEQALTSCKYLRRAKRLPEQGLVSTPNCPHTEAQPEPILPS